MKTNSLSRLFCLALMCLLTGFIAATDYGVYIRGIRVTSSNASDILNDGGSVVWNNSTATLTLTNATIGTSTAYGVIQFDSVYSCVTLNCIGTNTLTSQNPSGCGIYSCSQLLIKSNDSSTPTSLTINAIDAGISGNEQADILFAGASNFTLNVTAREALLCNKDLHLELLQDAHLSFNGVTSSSYSSYGIRVDGDVYANINTTNPFTMTVTNSSSSSYSAMLVKGEIDFDCYISSPSNGYFNGKLFVSGTNKVYYSAYAGTSVAHSIVITNGISYGLWVNGVRVTAANKSDILADGTASYDNVNSTLTLNGYNGDRYHVEKSSNSNEMIAANIFAKGALTVVKTGATNDKIETNLSSPLYVYDASTLNGCGIYSGGTLTLSNTGTGKLSINGNTKSVYRGIGVKVEGSSSLLRLYGNNTISISGTTNAIRTEQMIQPTLASSMAGYEGSDEASASLVSSFTNYSYSIFTSAYNVSIYPAYSLWVGGIRVDGKSKSGITGTGISGTVSFDNTTNTLTLNNATISSIYTSSTNYNSYNILSTGMDLNVNLVGNNTLSNNTQISNTNCISTSLSRTLTFTGSGSLTANTSGGDDNFTLYCKQAIFNGTGDIELTASGRSGSISRAICATTAPTIATAYHIYTGSAAPGTLASSLPIETQAFVKLTRTSTAIESVVSQSSIDSYQSTVRILTDQATIATIYNISGQQVGTRYVAAGLNYITDLMPGMYIVRLGNGTVEKVVVE